MPPRHVLIFGLKRSGTTIFWRSLSRDPRLTGYDEPFRPDIAFFVAAGRDPEANYTEYLARPELVFDTWVPMSEPFDVLLDRLTGPQRRWLQALTTSAPRTCIDMVRGHARIQQIRRAIPDALIIHLVRDPRCFVTSHLRPKGRWMSPALPERFFDYRGSFDFWQYHRVCQQLGFSGPAHVALLRLWKLMYGVAAAQSPDLTIRYQDFALDPRATLAPVYERLELDPPDLEYADVHPPRPPHAPEHPGWSAALRALAIPQLMIHRGPWG